jgi:hypothetical protein
MNPFMREVLESVDLNPDKFTDEQVGVILLPHYAPENYHQDGEISPRRAKELHNDRLCAVGINGSDRANALRLCS